MTTYYDIDDMPEEIREHQSQRLHSIWSEGVDKLFNGIHFLNSLIDRDGDLHFSRSVGYDDEFFTDVRLALPFDVEMSLKTSISDLRIIATALANKTLDFGYTKPNTTQQQGENK